MHRLITILAAVLLLATSPAAVARVPDETGVQETPNPTLVPVAEGWARNSVNAVIFRRSSVVSSGEHQYVAFYDSDSRMVLGRREHGSRSWQLETTPHRGNTKDAHNSISIGVDGKGVLHVAWDHHGNSLRYARGIEPGSLKLSEKLAMTGEKEDRVTYPEFYSLPDGELLFLYRDGSSGNGNLMLNRYDVESETWHRLQDGLIDGEGQRNAYWQLAVDPKGTIHLSWVWRESGDVATNHDLCYARSTNRGVHWERSDGEPYELPINARNAEYACRIPQGSELINQTSMCADSAGTPYIATYWRDADSDVPQYRLVYRDGESWRTVQVSRRTTPFSLSGGGTKRIPISRPQVVVKRVDSKVRAVLLFRDVERESRVSAAICDELGRADWRVEDLTHDPVEMWEPSFDPLLWNRAELLHVFVQRVGQGDGESLATFTAICAEECTVITLSAAEMIQLFEKDYKLGHILMQQVVELFKSKMNKHTRQFLHSLAIHPAMAK